MGEMVKTQSRDFFTPYLKLDLRGCSCWYFYFPAAVALSLVMIMKLKHSSIQICDCIVHKGVNRKSIISASLTLGLSIWLLDSNDSVYPKKNKRALVVVPSANLTLKSIEKPPQYRTHL